ncbi:MULTISPECIES: hypothetical protein [unclassified Streptomyces]|uniref:hypothetical protein n=1 Tax=unclassified Streptomyces TaxID=2593676 RepID=UPI0037B06570
MGQSTERAALIYEHSDTDRQREVAAGLDQLVRARRTAAESQAWGTDAARDTKTGPDNKQGPGR